MDINFEEKSLNKKRNYFINDMNMNISEINEERIKEYNKLHKSKINKELFNKENTNKINLNNNIFPENFYELNIQNLNIEPELKSENYIKAILNEDNFDKISEFFNARTNNDYIKYGIYLLNEKFHSIKDINILNKYDFKEIFFSILNYLKDESNKIDFEHILVKLIYNSIITYTTVFNNIDTSFLCYEKFLDLHLFFIDNISDMCIITNILKSIHSIVMNNINDNEKLICKIFEYNNKAFFNQLIEIINDYHNKIELTEIILQLFIDYINAFNNFKKLNSKKSIEIEMADNTYYYNNDIIENIYDMALILISNKYFDNSLFLINNIIKIIYKSKNLEISEKIISNKNINLMLNFILEKDYSNCQNNLIYMSEIIKYIIKLGFLDKNNNNINDLINSVENNLNENENILGVFINILINFNLKLKDKISIKLIEVILVIFKNEIYINDISSEQKYQINEIIIKYIQSSNYKIRKKIMKILLNLTSKKDYGQADFLIKNKILNYIKKAIDPSMTYCTDEKTIIITLKILNNFLTLGELFKNLNGVNTVLIEFENLGGKEMLDNLLCNKSENVFNYTSNLIDKYFN